MFISVSLLTVKVILGEVFHILFTFLDCIVIYKICFDGVTLSACKRALRFDENFQKLVGNNTRNRQFHLGSDLDRCLDLGIFQGFSVYIMCMYSLNKSIGLLGTKYKYYHNKSL